MLEEEGEIEIYNFALESESIHSNNGTVLQPNVLLLSYMFYITVD